ncbi:hypothetical protein FDZ58_01340 [Ehrlichia ruminantium]|nr:hypothetical protein FDZ65_01360 [Ehrlichia ruminantium]QLK53078.1 hypothetical protein FDZ64_01340 [Ehrlichia ruminantium]QLK53999.1 hypothetical protein FDZ63_01355 [Ehrlichia ruminantium]QLK57661.1 hypothetical protein FDZ59_01335 [Ehrlichia ruminantium]QLK58580.1 hypothetical protein FDZ58_01340 [Ehrlichia ruminantium]
MLCHYDFREIKMHFLGTTTIVIVIFIVSMLIAIMALIARYIISKRNKLTDIAFTSIPNLSQDDLSHMFNSVNTAIGEIDTPDTNYTNVKLQINNVTVSPKIIESSDDHEQQYELPESLIDQHTEYLQNNRNDNIDDHITRAILGACIHDIFSKKCLDNTPSIPLIHHMINHMYVEDYMHLLSNIVDQGIPDKEKYIIETTSILYKDMTLRYNTSSKKQFSIDINFHKKIALKDNPSIRHLITGNINFSISQSKDNPEILEYSAGKVLLTCHEFTQSYSIPSTARKYTIPKFTVNNHSIAQLLNNTSTLDPVTTTILPSTQELPSH